MELQCHEELVIPDFIWTQGRTEKMLRVFYEMLEMYVNNPPLKEQKQDFERVIACYSKRIQHYPRLCEAMHKMERDWNNQIQPLEQEVEDILEDFRCFTHVNFFDFHNEQHTIFEEDYALLQAIIRVRYDNRDAQAIHDDIMQCMCIDYVHDLLDDAAKTKDLSAITEAVNDFLDQ
jgi:hypothetical protein